MPIKLEPLYFGDKRLDTLKDAIMEEIYDRCGWQDIPLVAVIGTLRAIEHELLTGLCNG